MGIARAFRGFPVRKRLHQIGEVQRLYSTFAEGAPGAGLLLIRVVVGIGLIVHAAVELRGSPDEPLVVYLFDVVIGLLFLVGIYTPIVGAVLAVMSVWRVFLHPHTPWTCILLATLGAGLALLGPGAWSIDARLFGRREIDLPDRKH